VIVFNLISLLFSDVVHVSEIAKAVQHGFL